MKEPVLVVMKSRKWYVERLQSGSDDGITLVSAGQGKHGSPKMRKIRGPITLPLKHVEVVIREAS